MTSTGTDVYPMGPLGPPPTGTSSSGQPGTFPREKFKKNQCESLSPSFTSLSSASSPPLSESSSSLSSSNDSIVQVASSDNNAATITGNGYRQQRAGCTSGSDSFRDLNSRPRTPRPPRGGSSTSQTAGSSSTRGFLPTVILQKHNNITKAVTGTGNSNTTNALDIVQLQDEVEPGADHPTAADPNDLQSLSIVASGSVLIIFLVCSFFS